MKLIPKSFKARIIISVMLLHAILIGIIYIELSIKEADNARLHAKNNANTLATALAVNSPSWLLSSDINALTELLGSIQKINNIKSAYIMDKQGAIKASTDNTALNKIMSDKISLELIGLAGMDKTAYYEHSDMADVVMPIKIQNSTIGYARVLIDNSLSAKQIRDIYTRALVYIVLAIIFGGFLAYIAIRGMLSQMENLSNYAERIGRGEENVELAIEKDKNEVSSLANVFVKTVEALHEKISQSNLQQEQLHEQATELENINSHLKELVAEETNKVLKQEHMLLQQNRMAAMGEMIGAIAHQWRQPLNSLGLSIQDIVYAKQFGELDDEYIKKFKDDSMAIIRSLSNTIDDFRNFFKPNKQKTLFCIEDVISRTLTLVDAQFKNNIIEVRFDADTKHQIEGFDNEFGQVILNLLTNAKDAILASSNKNNGLIKISTFGNDSSVIIEVEDNGEGVDDGISERIFDPYFTTKEQGSGTGIGLYMSKEIVERHLGGKLSTYNSDNGAVFKVELPIKSSEPKLDMDGI